MEDLNRPISRSEIDLVIKNFLQTKLQVEMASQVYSTKYIFTRKELISILLKLFQKIEEEGTRHSLKKPITLIEKPGENTTKKITGKYLW